MKTGRFEANDCILEAQLAAENFRQSHLCVDAEVVSGTGTSQVAIDDECSNTFSLCQQPREIQGRQCFTFTDACTRDDKRAHLHALTSLQDSRAQRAILLG